MHPGKFNFIENKKDQTNNHGETILSLNSHSNNNQEYFFIPRRLDSKLKIFFNTSQLEALKSSIKKKGLTLIQGPPGTGKSTTILGILSVILNALSKKEETSRKDSVLNMVNQEFYHHDNSTLMEIDQLNTIDKFENNNSNINNNDNLFKSMRTRNKENSKEKNGKNYNNHTNNSENKDKNSYFKIAYNPKQQPWLWYNNYDNWQDEAIPQEDNFIEYPQSKKTDCFKILQKPVEDDISPPEKILVCAPSNVAIDEIVRKIISIGLIDSDGNKFLPKFVRIGPNYHPSLKEFALDYQMTEKVNSQEAKEMDKIKNEILFTVKIVCSTLSMAGSNILTTLNQKFDTVVIDEAAQAVELSTLIPLKYSCERLILVGDPKQLAATVFSETAIRLNYDQSLFKRFQEAGHEVIILKTQYRMHRIISKFISDTFYDSLLEDDINIANSTEKEPCLKTYAFQPLTFYDIESEERFENNSYFNEEQINVIIKLVQKLRGIYSAREIVDRLAIISPYSNQVYKIKDALKKIDFGFNNQVGYVDVNTVDGFQGKEKAMIIFSTVRSQGSKTIGFLSDERRMNVGLSRAKSCLVVIGDSKKLMTDKNWDKLVKYSFRFATFFKIRGDVEQYFDNFDENFKKFKVENEEQFVKMVFNPRTLMINTNNDNTENSLHNNGNNHVQMEVK